MVRIAISQAILVTRPTGQYRSLRRLRSFRRKALSLCVAESDVLQK